MEREQSAVSEPVRSDERQRCGCSHDVTTAWQTVICSKKVYTFSMNMRLLTRMMAFEHVCYRHGKMMASHLGLSTKRTLEAEIFKRLSHVYERRLEIGKLKTEEETYRWFRVGNRPARPSDGLGPYKFQHIREEGAFEFDQHAILHD